MELGSKLAEIAKVIRDHREVLETEEAAKNALVMPFLQALGFNVFNPAEVRTEFTCDVGPKRGEKVDYAICVDGQISMLVECKSAKSELSLNHASQLFRYFSVTDARIAVLTNGVVYKFFSDVDVPNKMDERPFLTIDLEALRSTDVKALSRFEKSAFDIEAIVEQAGTLKIQSLVHKHLQKEIDEPSEEFIRLVAGAVHDGRLTQAVKDQYRQLIPQSFARLVREKVSERLTSALTATSVTDVEDDTEAETMGDIETTPEEIEGFNIVRAIAARHVDPKRINMRDAKSYCAVLLDDNNRKTVARLHFNSETARYLGTFEGKDETKHSVSELLDIYQMADAIEKRVRELIE
ncbi:MAG: type I restriction endonuclease [Pacificimonas sp.]